MISPPTNASREGSLAVREEPRSGGSLFRKAVVSQLAKLRGGRILLRDELGDVHLGDVALDDGADHRAESLEISVADRRFYRSVALGGTVGAAESFMEDWWSTNDLVGLIRLLIRNIDLADNMDGGLARLADTLSRVRHRLRKNTRTGSRRNIHAHYDLGNEFFRLFLDDTLTYSCGVFETAQSTLEEASREKLSRICRKLRLSSTDHVVEIGTGWGSFAIHAAKHYGSRVTTTTISREQYDLARERVAAAGLSDRVTVLLEDYRDLSGKYDKLVSIEMIEAVGNEFLGTFFGKCSDLLTADGTMVLQAITMPDQRYERYLRSVDFIRKHVFPGCCVPSMSAMCSSIAANGNLRLVGLDDIGLHYATTLRHWRARFHDRLDDVRALGYPERFLRLWDFYLAYCEAGFAERYTSDVQMLLAKPRWKDDVSVYPGSA